MQRRGTNSTSSMRPLANFLFFLTVTALLAGVLPALRAEAAPVAASSPQGREAAVQTRPALATAEALLEDLSFRNLELHDRALLTRTPPGSISGKPSISFKPGPSSSGVPSAVHGSGRLAPARDLASYLGLLSRFTPGGVVCGRFNDWRTTSVYRSIAGLHYGYDIAFPAGTSIEAGWGGQVIGIANWYGTEYGVTVLSPQGFRTTYGHLAPLTHIGAWINPGDVVGRVVHDHVDVKMRDLSGAFIDFGHGVPGLYNGGLYVARGAPRTSYGGVNLTFRIHIRSATVPQHLPPLEGPPWTRHIEAVRAAISYLRLRYRETDLLRTGTAEEGALSMTRRELEDARGRLLVNGVPEDVLLAAFADTDALRQGELSSGDEPIGEAQASVIDERASRRGEMIRMASEALPKLNALLRDLNAQPSPRRT